MLLPDVSRILFMRADGIGDLLNSTPAIRWMRHCYPDAEITCLVTPLGAPILEGNPDIDQIWVDESRHLGQRWYLVRLLRRRKFDVAIALQTSSWCHYAVSASGATYRVGRDQKRFRGRLTHPDQELYRKGTVHEIERNLNLVSLICEGAASEKLVLYLTPRERLQARQTLEQMGIQTADSLILLHPGGSSYDKLWPASYFAEIGQRLKQQGLQVAVVHGPGESVLAAEVASPSGLPIIAPESLRALAALIQQTRLMVCNDSGPMHIASALGVPTVAIFGPTDHIRWGPKNGHIVRQDVSCWPCSAHKCRTNYACIKQLPAEMVWMEIQARIAA